MPKVVNRLDNVVTNEVSLVRRGANNKRVALTKGKDPMDPIKAVLETEAEGETDLRKSLVEQGYKEEAIEAMIKSFRLQAAYSDELGSAAVETVAKAAGYELSKAKKEDDDGDMDDDMKGKRKRKMPDMDKKDMKKNNEEVEMYKSALESLKKDFEDLRTSGLRKDFVSEAKEKYAYAPNKSVDQIADMLMKAHEQGPEELKSMRENFQYLSDNMRKSQLLQTSGVMGSSAEPHSGVAHTAWAQIQKAASEITEKSANISSNLASAQAMLKTLQNRPELYDQYLEENPVQIGKQP